MKDIFIVFATPYEALVQGVFTDLAQAKACKAEDSKFRSINHWAWDKKEERYVAQNEPY